MIAAGRIRRNFGGCSVVPVRSEQLHQPTEPADQIPPAGQWYRCSNFPQPSLVGVPCLVPICPPPFPLGFALDPGSFASEVRVEPFLPHAVQWVFGHLLPFSFMARPGRSDGGRQLLLVIISTINRRRQSGLSAAVHVSGSTLTPPASRCGPHLPTSRRLFFGLRIRPRIPQHRTRADPGAQQLSIVGKSLPVPAVHHPHGPVDLR